jgi:hypothetical protein
MTIPRPPEDEALHAMRPNRERLPQGLILRVVASTVAVGVALAFTTYLILLASEQRVRPSRRFPERSLPAPREQSNVRAEIFRVPRARPTVKDDQRARLQAFGWVDRAHDVVHIPIDRAIDVVAGEGTR